MNEEKFKLLTAEELEEAKRLPPREGYFEFDVEDKNSTCNGYHSFSEKASNIIFQENLKLNLITLICLRCRHIKIIGVRYEL